VCLAGIALAGAAGVSKERDLPAAQQKAAIKEFNLRKGILVATFSGVMSACFSYGLAAGDPIKEIALRRGAPTLWQGLPVLVVLLFGGFTTNFIWCVILNVRNRTGYQYFSSEVREYKRREQETIIETAIDAPSEEVVEHAGKARPEPARAPMAANYFFSALAGTTWYMQFFFYTMGETQMGEYKFSSWTMHMASIIIFSTLWGIALHEWRGSKRRTLRLLTLSLITLISSTVIVGYGTYLSTMPAGQ
jgi:L-rhamnose-H+ transport protein